MSDAATAPRAVTEPTIRHADANDYAAVRRHYAMVHDLHAAHMPDTFSPLQEGEFTVEQFSAYLDEDHLLLIAERDGTVAGSLSAAIQVTQAMPGFAPGLTVNIWHVLTEPAMRRRGVARALLAAAAEWGAAQNAIRIDLAVWAFNADALALYNKLGFAMAYAGLSATPSDAVARLGGGRLPERPKLLQPVTQWRWPKWLGGR